ncbi:MAG: hypothetical protein HC933_20675 [Pleurocapsa sp. SU_196_0]|nr:hypothetical protein [Pleurocapsa sp. SU_196_0]
MNRFLEPSQIPADAIVIDARPLDAYNAGHIPGARAGEFLQNSTSAPRNTKPRSIPPRRTWLETWD